MEIETLRQMQNTLIALSVDAIGRKTRWERFKSIPPDERVSLVNSELIPDPEYPESAAGLSLADQKVTQLKPGSAAAHPDLVGAIDAHGKIKEQLDIQFRGYESVAGNCLQGSRSSRRGTEEPAGQAKVDQILSARERMRPFEEAAQKREDEQRFLTTLKLTLRQREIDFQVPKKTIEILNTAEPPRLPSRPNLALNLTFAFLFGGVFARGGGGVARVFRHELSQCGDVETRLRLPVLGVIPFTARAVGRSGVKIRRNSNLIVCCTRT